MNLVKCGLRSITKKPLKSLLLLLAVFFISSFFMASISSRDARIETQDITRQAIGAAFRLEINESDRRARLGELPEVQYPNGSWGTPIPNNAFESLLMEDIKSIAGVSGIDKYNISTRTTVTIPVNFQRIEDPDLDQNNDFGGVNLYGNYDMEQDFNVLDENIRLIEGRFVSSQDKDSVVLSKELADLNNLSLGDKITFEPRKGGNKCSAEIIGIFEILHSIPSTMSGDSFRSENTIFSDLRLPEKVEGRDGDPCYKYATFNVEEVDEYEAVKKDIQALQINWARYDLLDNNGVSTQMSQNFSNLSQSGDFLLLITLVCGLMILLLIFTFWVKTRNHEFGIFLALGKAKWEIISQLIFEAVLICTAAFILAVALAPTLSGAMTEYLVDQGQEQILLDKEHSEGMISTSGNSNEGVNVVLGVSVTVGADAVIISISLSFVLVLISILTALIPILRRRPMEVLRDMS